MLIRSGGSSVTSVDIRSVTETKRSTPKDTPSSHCAPVASNDDLKWQLVKTGEPE